MNTRIATAFTAIILTASPAAFADTKQSGAPKTEEKKEAAKPYPLKTCIVSDDKLGGMGKPVVFVYEGQEIKLCCKDCRADFDKEPAKYLKKLTKK